MKCKMALVFLVGLAVLTLTGFATVNACGEGEEHGGLGHMGMSATNETGVSFVKDANIEVEYTSNGAVITITSDKPEGVKAIQTRAAKFGTIEESREVNAALVRSASFGDKHPVADGHAEGSDKCKGHEPGKHGHAEGSEECKQAHASGKCTGHQPGEDH